MRGGVGMDKIVLASFRWRKGTLWLRLRLFHFFLRRFLRHSPGGEHPGFSPVEHQGDSMVGKAPGREHGWTGIVICIQVRVKEGGQT